MQSWRLWCLLAMVAVGCTKPNPRSCADGLCTDQAFPFCDIDGTLGGEPLECIAVECAPMELAECRDDVAVTCNAAGNDYDLIRCEHLCNQDSGGCVECLNDEHCSNPSPICDLDTQECRTCGADAECASGVCDLATGGCVAAAKVVYAAPDGLGPAPCAEASPCPLDRAIMTAAAATEPPPIRMLPGTYDVALEVITGEKLLFVGTGATLRGAPSGPGVRVEGGAELEIRGLTIALQMGTLVASEVACGRETVRSALTLRDTSVRSADSTVINAGLCTLKIFESVVHADAGSSTVIRLESDASFEADRMHVINPGSLGVTNINALGQRITVRITNSVLDHVSVNASTSDPSTGSTQSEFYFAFNTWAASYASCNNPSNYRRTVHFENNILTSGTTDNVVFGTACTFENNLIFPQEPGIGVTNLHVDPQFVDGANRDYRLQATSPAIDAAVPSTTFTPAADFAGVARPQGAGHDIGAYELAP